MSPKQGEVRRQPKDWLHYDEGEPMQTYAEVYCCGQWMDSDAFTNTCMTCGKDYNWNGSLLAPREQWGEETGESLADIMGPGEEY